MNIKQIIFSFLIVLNVNLIIAQNNLPYNPQIDAKKQLDSVIMIAQNQNKNIFVQIGGNWCPWCIKMHKFYTEDQQLDSLMNADFVKLMVNFSKENKNLELMQKFDFPQRFGFPVIVILNSEGQRIHTQNTEYLEENGGYSKKKFIEFLKNWNKQALNAENYKK